MYPSPQKLWNTQMVVALLMRSRYRSNLPHIPTLEGIQVYKSGTAADRCTLAELKVLPEVKLVRAWSVRDQPTGQRLSVTSRMVERGRYRIACIRAM